MEGIMYLSHFFYLSFKLMMKYQWQTFFKKRFLKESLTKLRKLRFNLLVRVKTRYMGSEIKGLQEGGIKDHSLGIGMNAVFHSTRDQTDRWEW